MQKFKGQLWRLQFIYSRSQLLLEVVNKNIYIFLKPSQVTFGQVVMVQWQDHEHRSSPYMYFMQDLMAVDHDVDQSDCSVKMLT